MLEKVFAVVLESTHFTLQNKEEIFIGHLFLISPFLSQ